MKHFLLLPSEHGTVCLIVISPGPTKDRHGERFVDITRCLRREELSLSPLMCGQKFNQINEQTDGLENQTWVVMGITALNLIGLIVNGLARCRRQTNSKEEAKPLKVYRYQGNFDECEHCLKKKNAPLSRFWLSNRDPGWYLGAERQKYDDEGQKQKLGIRM